MYDELIRRLRELHPEEFGDAWDFAFACQQAMCEAADVIEELSKQSECPYWYGYIQYCSMLGKAF